MPVSSANSTFTLAGHFIFECKSTRPYVSRPSRTQQLAKVNPLDKLKFEGKPSVDVPDEFKTRCLFKTPAHHSHVLTLLTPNQNRNGQQATRSQRERTREGQARRIVHERETRKETEEVSPPCLQTRRAGYSRLLFDSPSASSSSSSQSDSDSDSDSGSDSDSSSSGSDSDSSRSSRSRSRSRPRSPDHKRRRGRSASPLDNRDSRRGGSDRRKRHSSEDSSGDNRRRR